MCICSRGSCTLAIWMYGYVCMCVCVYMRMSRPLYMCRCRVWMVTDRYARIYMTACSVLWYEYGNGYIGACIQVHVFLYICIYTYVSGGVYGSCNMHEYMYAWGYPVWVCLYVGVCVRAYVCMRHGHVVVYVWYVCMRMCRYHRMGMCVCAYIEMYVNGCWHVCV